MKSAKAPGEAYSTIRINRIRIGGTFNWQINSAQISRVLVDAHAEEQNQHVSGVLRTAHCEALIREADHLACQSWSERMKKRAATTVVKPTYGEPRLARTDAADFGSLPKREYLKFSIAKATHTSA
jgi:hypothetical protein